MDFTDAKVIDTSQRPRVYATNNPIGVLNIPVDSLIYDMKHSQRGKCLIFNHQTFDSETGCRPRLGTDRDANSVARCFHKLEFDVVQFMDASYRDIREALIRVSAENHSERDCIAIVVLTHGNEESLWARDMKYPIDTLFTHFHGNRCPTLMGKPKIFIIQAKKCVIEERQLTNVLLLKACRGELLDPGSRILALGGQDVVDGPQPVYKIPSHADIVVYYSTAPGHYSFRNTENGSYFIQTMVSVLNEYCYKFTIDLLTLFTIVNRRVAYDFESYVPNDKEYHKKKQIPCIQSQLTRLIYMAPKPLQRSGTF